MYDAAQGRKSVELSNGAYTTIEILIFSHGQTFERWDYSGAIKTAVGIFLQSDLSINWYSEYK